MIRSGLAAVLLMFTPVFGFPSASALQDAPLPGAEAFLRTVQDNLARAERATHLYTYRERRTDIHTNPFGRLGTGGTSLFEVYPSPMRQLVYRRLVARNGVPLADSEVSDQDGEYRKRVGEVRRQRGVASADESLWLQEESARARGRRQRAIEDVIGALQFRMSGRVAFEGAPAIVVTFAPKPGVEPATRQGRIAQKLAGTIWIHESAAEVMYVEAESIDDISYGLGMVARLSEGAVLTMRRRPVDGDLWMPTTLTLTARGRAVLVRRLVVEYASEWFDYRRLPVESLAPFVDPRIFADRGP